MISNLQLFRAILIAVIAASFTLVALGKIAAIATGVALISFFFYIQLIIEHRQVIYNNFAAIEAQFGFTSEYDKKFWGIKPKYDDMKFVFPTLGVFLGPYTLFASVSAANGSQLPRLGKFVFALFGLIGVVFAFALIGTIICSGTIEFTYYLWMRKKTK